MKVYWLDYHPAFNTISFNEFQDYESTIEIIQDGKPVSAIWQPLNMTFENKDRSSDFLYRVGGSLVVSAKTKELLSKLTDRIEFLPLNSDFECYILNVLTVLDCIDSKNSKEKSSGYEELSFYQEVVKGHDIFRIKVPQGERILDQIYVSEVFKEEIESNLEGFQLIEIWNSDFSWQQKEEKYFSLCDDVDRSLVEFFNFEKAIKFIKNNRGKQTYSGKWSLKVDEDNDILLGQLQLDGTYNWICPVYYPPIILGLEWGVKEKRNSLFSKLKEGISFR